MLEDILLTIGLTTVLVEYTSITFLNNGNLSASVMLFQAVNATYEQPGNVAKSCYHQTIGHPCKEDGVIRE